MLFVTNKALLEVSNSEVPFRLIYLNHKAKILVLSIR